MTTVRGVAGSSAVHFIVTCLTCVSLPCLPPVLPQVCYYRDKNSINKFQLAKVTAEGVTVSGAQAAWVCAGCAACLLHPALPCSWHAPSAYCHPSTSLLTPPPPPNCICRAVCAGDELELQAVCQPGGQRAGHVVMVMVGRTASYFSPRCARGSHVKIADYTVNTLVQCKGAGCTHGQAPGCSAPFAHVSFLLSAPLAAASCACACACAPSFCSWCSFSCQWNRALASPRTTVGHG